MGRSHETFSKKEVRKKKEKKRQDKEKKKQDRKLGGKNDESEFAYVDEFGNLTSTPPDLSKRVAINVEDIEIGIPRGLASDVNETIRKGIVSFFNDSKGFGFIKDVSTQQDVFVHVSGLLETIKENNKVTFEIVKGAKGPNAVNVKIDRE